MATLSPVLNIVLFVLMISTWAVQLGGTAALQDELDGLDKASKRVIWWPVWFEFFLALVYAICLAAGKMDEWKGVLVAFCAMCSAYLMPVASDYLSLINDAEHDYDATTKAVDSLRTCAAGTIMVIIVNWISIIVHGRSQATVLLQKKINAVEIVLFVLMISTWAVQLGGTAAFHDELDEIEKNGNFYQQTATKRDIWWPVWFEFFLVLVYAICLAAGKMDEWKGVLVAFCAMCSAYLMPIADGYLNLADTAKNGPTGAWWFMSVPDTWEDIFRTCAAGTIMVVIINWICIIVLGTRSEAKVETNEPDNAKPVNGEGQVNDKEQVNGKTDA